MAFFRLRHPFFSILLFCMPFVLEVWRLFTGSGIPFSRFCFLACRLCLGLAGFSPVPASLFLDFAFWHAVCAWGLSAFYRFRHPFFLILLFGMPFALEDCRLFPGSSILFSWFCFLACRLCLGLVGFFPAPASFFLDFAFWHAVCAWDLTAFPRFRHPFFSILLFGMPFVLRFRIFQIYLWNF